MIQAVLGLLKRIDVHYSVSYSFLLVTLSFFASPSVLAMQTGAPFLHEKTYTLLSGKKVAVTFRERQCKSSECREVDGGLWGTDGGMPRFVTEAFLVFIDGRQFYIPEKFYKDLTNTHQVNVSEQRDRVII